MAEVLEEAINIAGLFAGPGPMVQQKDARSRAFASNYSKRRAYDGPLVVMIDRHSASASVILAGQSKIMNVVSSSDLNTPLAKVLFRH